VGEVNPAHSKGDVILFSGCEDSQDSEDASTRYESGGAMTQSFIKAYEKTNVLRIPNCCLLFIRT